MSEEAVSECPVCYEKLTRQTQSPRTLTCKHVFCHDCLVKTIISQEGQPKKVVCPVCRHVTFLHRRSVAWIVLSKEDKQTLEIPMSPTASVPESLPPESPGTIPPHQPSLLRRLFCSCPRTLTPSRNPAVNTSRIFVISGRGRPMSEEEVVRAPGEPVVLQRRRCRLRWVLVLLCFVIIGAVIAAILPWVISK